LNYGGYVKELVEADEDFFADRLEKRAKKKDPKLPFVSF
jgi:hypothetical protein